MQYKLSYPRLYFKLALVFGFYHQFDFEIDVFNKK